MSKIAFVGLILALFLSRVYPLLSNDFYFTQDQGRDAVYVREILHGRFPTQGPESTIPGIYHGVGWYYLLAIGYWLTGGHPAGGPLVLVTVSATVTGLIIWKLKRPDVGALLVFFWPHYDLTRYAFNPFLLFPLLLLQLLLLPHHFIWAAIPTSLVVHAHVIAGLPIVVLYLLYGLIKRPKFWILGFLILGFMLTPLWLQLGNLRAATSAFQWRDWYVTYLWPVLLIALLYKVKAKLVWLLLPIFIITFYLRYPGHQGDDSSLLKNELAAVDWVYQQANNQGFAVYTYLPSVYDYPYQYLIWWRGIKKYQYLPCEYSTYPGAPDTFVPHKPFYTEPKKACANLHFLIIEPDSLHPDRQYDWLTDLQTNTQLVSQTQIGKIRLLYVATNSVGTIGN